MKIPRLHSFLRQPATVIPARIKLMPIEINLCEQFSCIFDSTERLICQASIALQHPNLHLRCALPADVLVPRLGAKLRPLPQSNQVYVVSWN